MTDILIVEDDKELADLLTDFLREEGYTVSNVDSGERAVQLFERYGARLVVLDINLPDMNGFAVCSKLRENADTPILIVSSRTGKGDKLNGFDLGADDYIEKPYNPAELTARVAAQLRRYHTWGGSAPKQEEDRLVNGGIVLDRNSKTAEVDGQEVKLTATEYRILELLMEHPGQVFSAEQIYEKVWKEIAGYAVENTVMVAPPSTHCGIVVKIAENLGIRPASSKNPPAKAKTTRLTTLFVVTIPTFCE